MELVSTFLKTNYLKPYYYFGFGLFAVLGIGYAATPFMGVASLAYFLMITGVIIRKGDKRLHAKFMASAMSLDLSLVLILEVQRGAINTAAQFSLSGLQQSHILMSTMAVLLYFPVAFIGYNRLRKKWTGPKSRTWHIRLAWAAFVFRTLGFILMFTLIEYYAKKAGAL